LPYDPGGSVAHALDADQVSFVDHSLELSPLPAGTLGAELSVMPRRSERAAGPVLHGVAVLRGAALLASVRVPALDFVSYQLSAAMLVREAGPRIELGFDRRSSELPAALHWSPEAAIAAFTSECAVNVADPAQPAVSWHLTPDAPLGDAVEVEGTWDVGGPVRWRAVAAAERSGSLRLPELPREAQGLLPPSSSAIDLRLRHIDLAGIEGLEQYLSRYEQGAYPSSTWSSARL
jgi:hypothetical protein